MAPLNTKKLRTHSASTVREPEPSQPAPIPEVITQTVPPVTSERKKYEDAVFTLFISACFAIYCFLALLAFYAPSGILEPEEFKLFTNSWLLIPPAALAAAWLIGEIKRRWFRDSQLLLPLLLSVNAFYILVALHGLFQVNGQLYGNYIRTAPSADEIQETCTALTWILIAGPVLNLTILGALRYAPGLLPASMRRALTVKRFLYFMAPFGSFLFLRLFLSDADGRHLNYYLAAVPALGCLLIERPPQISKKGLRIAIDCIVGLLVMMVVFDTGLNYTIEHYSFYLGPVNDYLAGRTPLVDVSCQYGVGVIIFLGLLVKMHLIPLTFHAVSALICVLTGIEYIMLYSILRAITRSLWTAVAGVFLIVIVNYFSTMGYAAAYPSIGPLRFGFFVLIIAIEVYRRWWPRWPRLWLALEGATLGCASVWSMESFIYVAMPLAAIIGYELLSQRQWSRAVVKRYATRLAANVGFLLLAHIVMALHVRFHSGQWPHWDYYLSYIILYTKSGFGTLLMKGWGPWVYFSLIYLLSLLAVGFKLIFFRKESFADGALVAAIAAGGVAEMPYFVGRSHSNNLYHIAVPAICLACFWLAWLYRQRPTVIPTLVRRTATYIFCLGAIAATLYGWPNTKEKGSTSLLGLTLGLTPPPQPGQSPASLERIVELFWSPSESDPQTWEAIDLIHKYFKDSPTVPMLVPSSCSVEALIDTGKTNLFPLSCPAQDEIEPGSYIRKLDTLVTLKDGDFIITGPDEKNMGPLQTEIYNQVKSSFRLMPIALSPHKLEAIKLMKK